MRERTVARPPMSRVSRSIGDSSSPAAQLEEPWLSHLPVNALREGCQFPLRESAERGITSITALSRLHRADTTFERVTTPRVRLAALAANDER